MCTLGPHVCSCLDHMCSRLDHTCSRLNHTCVHAWTLCMLAPGPHTCSHRHPQVTTVSVFQGTLWVSLIHGSSWGLRHFRAPSPCKTSGEGTLQAADCHSRAHHFTRTRRPGAVVTPGHEGQLCHLVLRGKTGSAAWLTHLMQSCWPGFPEKCVHVSGLHGAT